MSAILYWWHTAILPSSAISSTHANTISAVTAGIVFHKKENVLSADVLMINLHTMKQSKPQFPIFVYALFLTVIAFVSCGEKNDEDTPEKTAKRTVLIYMCGENNLDTQHTYDPVTKMYMTYFASDSAEIVRGAKQLPDNVNLIVFADKKSKRQKPFIAKVDKDGMHITKQYKEEEYSIDKDFMTEVVKWTFAKYPAESYAMTFWGHGNGWIMMPENYTTTTSQKVKRKAYGTDTGSDNADGGDGYEKHINIPQLAEVLSQAPHLDYVFFDCCQMMSAEVVYELRNVCDYIIGSPAEIPGFGAPYEYVVPAFFLPKDEVGRAIIDNYIIHSDFSEYGGQPLSAVKTKNMENLLTVTKNCIDTVMVHYPYPNNIPLYDIIYYGRNPLSASLPIFYDLRNVMRKYLSEKDFEQWDNVFQQTVVYSIHPKDITETKREDWMSSELSITHFHQFKMNDENYGGLSIFIPQTYYSDVSYRYLNPNVSIKALEWSKTIDWTQYNWE